MRSVCVCVSRASSLKRRPCRLDIDVPIYPRAPEYATRIGADAVVRRSGPYTEPRTPSCRARWGIDAAGVDKHRPRSEKEKSTRKSTTFFHVPTTTLSQDTGMPHCDRKPLAGRTASGSPGPAWPNKRVSLNPRPAHRSVDAQLLHSVSMLLRRRLPRAAHTCRNERRRAARATCAPAHLWWS